MPLPLRELAARHYVVLRNIAYGPFDGAEAAFAFAEKHWPDEDHCVQALHDQEKL